ncbi:uncharacterized protein LOC144137713 [Haemaphysalis longicornis]
MASKQGNKQPLSALEQKMLECSNLFEKSFVAGPKQRQQHPQQKWATPVVAPAGPLVPPAYRELERRVLGPRGDIEGALVCSLLLASGLPRPTLGRIWDLCSRTRPGSFTQRELHAALALVALAQAGHAPSLELLARLPQLPVPVFPPCPPNGSSRPWPPPSQPQHPAGPAGDDDFDDFKSAPSKEAAAAATSPPRTDIGPPEEDDFADFQAAFPPSSLSPAPPPTGDRYSALKDLLPTQDVPSLGPLPQHSDAAETWHNPLPEVDDFGDFCHVQVIAPSTPEKPNLLDEPLCGAFSSQSHDSVSIGDGLSVNSLDFGAREGSLSSRHGSVLSLDFRVANSDDEETTSARTAGSDEGRGSTAARVDSQEEGSPEEADGASDAQPDATSQPILLLDKYSVIRGLNQEEVVGGEAACMDSWARCLESVLELVAEADSIFNRDASSQVCREALDTEEGGAYVRNLCEVYRVCQRIALASRLLGLHSDQVDSLCGQVQATWQRLASFLENSCLLSLEVSPAEDPRWLPSGEESARSCGVCLLNVDNADIAPSKLSYSGREYHSPCANLWVNCVNSLLPAVTPVQLL